MKKILPLISILLLSSCVSTKYNIAENKGNFQNVQAGSKYTFFTLDQKKHILEVTSVEKDSIIGKRKDENFAIAKSNISKINKNKTGATILLVAGSAAVIGFVWLVADTSEKVVEALLPKTGV